LSADFSAVVATGSSVHSIIHCNTTNITLSSAIAAANIALAMVAESTRSTSADDFGCRDQPHNANGQDENREVAAAQDDLLHLNRDSFI